jgi:hypothetical protein
MKFLILRGQRESAEVYPQALTRRPKIRKK